jgi:hypothetical protein
MSKSKPKFNKILATPTPRPLNSILFNFADSYACTDSLACTEVSSTMDTDFIAGVLWKFYQTPTFLGHSSKNNTLIYRNYVGIIDNTFSRWYYYQHEYRIDV